jgi:hypothetical protein
LILGEIDEFGMAFHLRTQMIGWVQLMFFQKIVMPKEVQKNACDLVSLLRCTDVGRVTARKGSRLSQAIDEQIDDVITWWPYRAPSTGILSFNKGEKIRVIFQNRGFWWVGEKSGVVGIFPKTYVRRVIRYPNVPNEVPCETKLPVPSVQAWARILWDFITMSEYEMTLSAGTEVKVLSACKDGFYQVQKGNTKGYIQSDYCSPIYWMRGLVS